LCEPASSKEEILAVVPLKAEGAPVPGAGFSPEAVPGNSAEMEDTGTTQLLSIVGANVVETTGTFRRICSEEAVEEDVGDGEEPRMTGECWKRHSGLHHANALLSEVL
jgi:hypothetical protein